MTGYTPSRGLPCHALKVNPLKEYRCIDEVTIAGVPFCDLKGIQIKTMEIYDTKPNLCHNLVTQSSFMNKITISFHAGLLGKPLRRVS